MKTDYTYESSTGPSRLDYQLMGSHVPGSGASNFDILGPENVPGLTKYKYKIDLPEGTNATDIQWSVDTNTASFDGPTNQVEVTVVFANTKADWIKLSVSFKVDGMEECPSKQIALVRVQVANGTFTRPGKASTGSTGNFSFLVNPPGGGAAPNWITTHSPGSEYNRFTYNGTNQAEEPFKSVDSNGGGGGPAYRAETKVTLTSPTERPTAQRQIQVGYIQHLVQSGSATYATTPAGRKRTVRTAGSGSNSIDWLSSTTGPGRTDEWPWYDESARERGGGSGSWCKTISLTDSPTFLIAGEYSPNCAGNANKNKTLTTGSFKDSFTIFVAARTTDTALDADEHYFQQAHTHWTVNYRWPVAVPAVSIVTFAGPYFRPTAPSEIEVNIVPAATLGNRPYQRQLPDDKCPGNPFV